MKRKIIKWLLASILGIAIVGFITLNIYASDYYTALNEMTEAIENEGWNTIEREDERRYTTFHVTNAKANIIFIPGGLVEGKAYEYLALGLANEGYNVTIFKPFYKLAILSPNYASRYIDESLDNIIIGHSLGGVVASMIAANEDEISQVILLGSYPIRDITGKDVLIITAEHDDNMNQEAFNDSLQYVSEQAVIFNILGGNHAQFGWYGEQAKDGQAEISTINQQNIVITQILQHIE